MATIKVNDININYEWTSAPGASRASDPVVLLSNSLSSNLSMWDAQIDALIKAGFRVLRYDSRGHGNSDAPDQPYTIPMLADDAIGLLDALNLEKVHFCGLSMGGMVGQRLAYQHPQRLISVTLCATAAFLSAPGVWDERAALVRAGGMAAVVDATLERWFTAQASNAIPEQLAAVREGILNTPVAGYANSCAAIRDMDQREAIRSITLPTLVIAGEKDPSTPVAAAEEIAAAITGAKLEVIADAQHLLNIEKADAFNSILVQFLLAHHEPHTAQ